MSALSFNWVQAQADCSLAHVFGVLAEIVDSDVKAANALRRPRVTFKCNPEATNKIMVSRARDMGGITEATGVVFELLADRINIIRKRGTVKDEEPWFFAVACLDEQGECSLEIDGKRLKLWQVSRRALANLFFDI